MILASGRRVAGVDQSRAMLARAREKHPAILARKLGLQELDYEAAFRAAICMDAMENICPEDWPRVLGNLHRALEPNGQLYFTVELAAEKDIERDFVAGERLGLPVVYGESAVEGGYHYYPRLEQVRAWLGDAKFNIVEETTGDEYQHFWAQKF
jgi:SAM-dependent methyltransferase